MPQIPWLQFALVWHWSLFLFTPASMETFCHFNSGALGQLTLCDSGALGQHWSLTQFTTVSMEIFYLILEPSGS